MNKQDLLDLLIYSLDHPLDAAQQQQLDLALQNSEELRREKAQLLQMRALVSSIEMAASNDFVEGVMSKVTSQQSQSAAKIIYLFPRVAAACIAFFVLVFSTLYLMENTYTVGDNILGIEELTPEDALTLLED